MSVTEEQVLGALKSVEDPDLHKDIVTLGFVKDVRIQSEDTSDRRTSSRPATF